MNKNQIEQIVIEALKEQEAFLVELTIGANNKINVKADSLKGMTIQRLKMVNRNIEQGLDRDAEDFDLTISSPGLDMPFKVFEQYQVSIGRMIKITTLEEEILEGRLKEVKENLVVIETKAVKKVPSKLIEVALDTIKETKIIIEFK